MFNMQAVAKLSMLVAVLILCVMAHVLINHQKKLAFQKIEEGVKTNLEVEKESSKQVSGSLP